MLVQWFNSIDLYIFSSAVLLILLIGSIRFGFGGEKSTSWFQFMLINVLILLILEVVLKTISLNPWGINKYVVFTGYSLYYLLTPLTAIGGTYYLFELVRKNEEAIPSFAKYLFVPVVFHFFIIVTNPIHGWYFQITPELVYERGSYFYISPLISFSYMLFSIIYLLIYRKNIKKNDYWFLMQFGLIPIMAGATQALFYGIDITWPSFTLALLLIYLRIQKDQIVTDKLTGLKNRRCIDTWLKSKFNKNTVLTDFTGILFDLNDFKEINDTWGHQAGDAALIAFSRCLLESFRKEDVIGRYGGDEFIVLILSSEQSTIERAIGRFSQNIAEYNERTLHPWTLKFSFGFEICKADSSCTKAEFFSHLDKKMYSNKISSR